MSQRFNNSILVCLCVALSAPGVMSQEKPVQHDSRAKYRQCALQARMFDGYCMVSMVDLIANPDLFDGMKVLVAGYVHVEFEGRGIFLHKDDFVFGILRNGLWLGATKSVDLTKCQDRYASVRGTFKAGLGGHGGVWSGTLEEVSRCDSIDRAAQLNR